MKNITLCLLVILGWSASSFAQDSEKIKGDRNLTIKQTYVDEFKKIIIGEDFKVELFYNKKPSVEIETDDNLHEYINIAVVEGVLTLASTGDIRPRKLEVKINYGDMFSDIEVKDDAEVRSLTSLELNNAMLKTSGSSRAYLNIKTDSFNFVSTEKSKVKLNITATDVVTQISDNTKMDALINASTAKIDLYQRANADIEGTINTLTLRGDNNSQFNGKNFTAKTCEVIAEFASDVYVEVTESISIAASGSSEVYLYGNPQITITKFTDTVKLQKKEK
ncbi:GIN domain-containing protein [Psychroserpens sp. BH13MA-6]